MTIQLESIQFNNNTTVAGRSSLNLRIDLDRELPLPEWIRGRQQEDQYPAAYTLAAIEREPEIVAEFSCSDHAIKNAVIRAVSHNLVPHTLGAVKPLEITFKPATPPHLAMSGPQRLQLTALFADCVGVHNVKWLWQYWEDNQWKDFESSEHQIYVVLKEPGAPWKLCNNDTAKWPWSEVLKHSCEWANGAKSLPEAATLVTERVYDLGNPHSAAWPGLTYTRLPNLSGDCGFYCGEFLAWLKKESGKNLVNCTDCACIVSTFANILGCNLLQSKMDNYCAGSPGYFQLNKIIPIGLHEWWPINSLGHFSFHEVAWEEDYGTNARLYDACLKVNGNLCSHEPPIPELPTNILFGSTGSGKIKYRDKLAADTPFGRPFCTPQPETAQARPLAKQPRFLRKQILCRVKSRNGSFEESEKCKMLKALYRFNEWYGKNPLCESLFVSRFRPDFACADVWKTETVSSSRDDSREIACTRSIWRPNDCDKRFGPLLLVESYECSSPKEAHLVLLNLLGTYPNLMPRRPGNDVGDVAFGDDHGHARTFARANFVFAVRNASSFPWDVGPVSQTIDQMIIAKPQNTVGPDNPIIKDFRVVGDSHNRGEKIPLVIDVKLPPDSKTQTRDETTQAAQKKEVWWKIYSSPGEVFEFRQQFVYRSNKGGPQKLTAFAITADNHVATKECHFNIE